MASITDVAREAGVKRDDVKKVMNAITGIVRRGERVTFKEFGTFFPRTRKARTARNPRTGDSVKVPSKTKMAFRTKVELKDTAKKKKGKKKLTKEKAKKAGKKKKK